MVKNQVLICAEGFFFTKRKKQSYKFTLPISDRCFFFIPLKTSESHRFWYVFKGVNGNFGLIWVQPEIDIQTFSKIYSKDFESEKINSDKKSISKKYS